MGFGFLDLPRPWHVVPCLYREDSMMIKPVFTFRGSKGMGVQELRGQFNEDVCTCTYRKIKTYGSQ